MLSSIYKIPYGFFKIILPDKCYYTIFGMAYNVLGNPKCPIRAFCSYCLLCAVCPTIIFQKIFLFSYYNFYVIVIFVHKFIEYIPCLCKHCICQEIVPNHCKQHNLTFLNLCNSRKFHNLR